MPKEVRRRSGAHEQSVRLHKRQFAAQDNAVEHVEVGKQTEKPAPEILADMAVDEESRPAMKKKEKLALKHELFLKRLEESRSPYSKSHERRLKRKAKEQVAGGLGDIKAAISALEEDIPVAVQNSVTDATETDRADASKPAKPKPKPGQIGEGKGAPLNKNQRKKALQLERMRIPLILATPEFATNPFQTIRTHAQNTLVKHEPPAAS
ncbi:hypothetical protein PYCCODRAFT_240787 [Trametes coccinea BRFM310]|uniref:Ribosome biogenesis protein SLX9 n=1 Tax=Trametes coccinea (strain BRFM310) TaxID=1353009 RepID=A0A1Y2IRB0_TRAC3|nr:hypothetical protein PYCCODRAFT_240787 [Trametes coccinea BRFM310]